MAHLVLVRHGKSKWNALGLWTGLTDIPLAEEGITEARKTGGLLKDISFHEAHVSALTRAHQTFAEIAKAMKREDLSHQISPALNERHYGDYTGKNKWEVKKEIGDEAFERLRRGWDEPVPGGETLKDVHARVAPYYDSTIKPALLSGKNVLVVAHGNSLRALAKHLENLDESTVCKLEIETGQARCYEIGHDGAVLGVSVIS